LIDVPSAKVWFCPTIFENFRKTIKASSNTNWCNWAAE